MESETNPKEFIYERIGNINPQHISSYISLKYSIPKGSVYKMIKNKKILLNGAKINCLYRLKPDDIITIKHNPLITEKNYKNATLHNDESNINAIESIKKKKALSGYDKFLQKIIIYEDNDILFIDKPIGWSTQGGINSDLNIDALLTYHLSEHYLVHRLDKDTSGGLLVAKNRAAAAIIGKMIQKRDFYKEYIAIIPRIARDNWECTSYIENREKNREEDENHEDLEDKEHNSHTVFQKIKELGKYSVVKVMPITGRKHQIRIHCAYIKHPILGDKKYYGEKAKRLYLHSHRIKFQLKGKDYDLIAKHDFNI